MNNLWKAIALVGNVSEVIIASTMVADLISKIRGNKTATTSAVGKPNPDPVTPMAA